MSLFPSSHTGLDERIQSVFERCRRKRHEIFRDFGLADRSFHLTGAGTVGGVLVRSFHIFYLSQYKKKSIKSGHITDMKKS